jgi:diguanylate cyclase (GGDEF)-like protein/PAS domain S-box-containing protein
MTAKTEWERDTLAAIDHFFAISFDLLLALDDERVITRASALWERTLGWSADDMIGVAFHAFVHPDDAAGADALLDDLPTDAVAANCHSRWRAADGRYRDFEWNLTINPGDGTVYALARDVTQAHVNERRYRALNAAWLAVASEASIRDVLGVVTDQARQLIGGRQAVTSLSVGADWAQTISAVSLSDEYAEFRSYDGMPDGTGIYAEVLRTGRPMRMSQEALEAHPLWRGFGEAAPHHPPMRGWLAVPMTSRAGESLGMIQLSDKADGTEFDADDEAVLTEFARVASLTIERAQAEETAQRARGEIVEMLDSMSDAFVAFDSDWRITYINPSARRAVRIPGEVVGVTVWEAFPQADPDRFRAQLEAAMAARRSTSFRTRNPVTGTWFEIRTSPFRTGLAVYFVDVTEHEAATDDLERRVAMQAVVAEIGQAALTGVDVDKLIEETVTRVSFILAVGSVGVLQLVEDGQTLVVRSGVTVPWSDPPAGTADKPSRFAVADVAGNSIDEAMRRFDWAVVDHDGARERPGRRTAERYGIRSEIAAPIGRPGMVWGVLVGGDAQPGRFGVREGVFLAQVAHILSSAIERQASEDAVRHQATHDALTGLPNRQLLRDRMDTALGRTGDAATATLLFLDLDGFKDVNDSLGHATGDVVLRQVADRLRALVGADGDTGTVARLGGDEFAVFVDGPCTDDGAVTLAQRVVAAVAVPFSLAELDVPLSTSVGVVRAPLHGTDASTLMRRADVAMYRAKQQALGWAVYDPTIDAARADRLTTIAELRRGILDGELELHYQPIMDLQTGAVSSLEALVRWRHPVNGLVAPMTFIPLAEQTGLIVPLTTWVVDEALRQSSAWSESGLRLRIAVNLSVDVLTRDIANDPLLERLAEASDRLTAEITETSLADERARRAVRNLVAAGVSCAVDDFGTGYSSLAYLKDLPVAQLKIDRTFVQDVTRTPRDMAIVRSVADLGAALALDVVAEGVENEESAQALRACGVRLAQGYLFARPMPAADLEKWLAERS